MGKISQQGSPRIYIADNYPMILDSFSNMFSKMHVSILVKGFIELPLLEKALSYSDIPDLILIDFDMSGFGSIDAISNFRRRHHACRIAVFSSHVDSKLASDIVQLGCCGYIPKTLPSKAIYHAVLLMIDGGIFVPDFLTITLPDTFSNATQKHNFTLREIDVLRALAKGITNKEIARELNIAEATVKLHLRHAFNKLKVSNRVGAVRAVMEGALDN